jgi:hypothetical protein
LVGWKDKSKRSYYVDRALIPELKFDARSERKVAVVSEG